MLAVAAFSALALAACGDQSALALAQQACGKVHASVVSYDAGIQASNPSTKARDLKKAENDLQEAEPLAAQATSADGQWNALMTTLNEIGQVDEKHLIAALQSQCAVANSGQPEIPERTGEPDNHQLRGCPREPESVPVEWRHLATCRSRTASRLCREFGAAANAAESDPLRPSPPIAASPDPPPEAHRSGRTCGGDPRTWS